MRGRDYDIAYGLHSNIPTCCIIFYLTEWTSENERDSPYARAVHADNLNYVPCPECLALKRHNVLRLCETDCKKRCYAEFSEREPTPLEAQTIRVVSYHLDEVRYKEWRNDQ